MELQNKHTLNSSYNIIHLVLMGAHSWHNSLEHLFLHLILKANVPPQFTEWLLIGISNIMHFLKSQKLNPIYSIYLLILKYPTSFNMVPTILIDKKNVNNR